MWGHNCFLGTTHVTFAVQSEFIDLVLSCVLIQKGLGVDSGVLGGFSRGGQNRTKIRILGTKVAHWANIPSKTALLPSNCLWLSANCHWLPHKRLFPSHGCQLLDGDSLPSLFAVRDHLGLGVHRRYETLYNPHWIVDLVVSLPSWGLKTVFVDLHEW